MIKKLKLSKNPGTALLQAVDDLEWAEKQPGYKINMDTWYFKRIRSCSVCLAGAVLARGRDPVVGKPDNRILRDFRYPSEKVRAFNWARKGHWVDFLREFSGLFYSFAYSPNGRILPKLPLITRLESNYSTPKSQRSLKIKLREAGRILQKWSRKLEKGKTV